MTDELRAAVAAGVLGSEDQYRALLQSVVDVARAIFRAKASSILLLDTETDELVFEAAADEASESLIGKRFPSGERNLSRVRSRPIKDLFAFSRWVTSALLSGGSAATPLVIPLAFERIEPWQSTQPISTAARGSL